MAALGLLRTSPSSMVASSPVLSISRSSCSNSVSFPASQSSSQCPSIARGISGKTVPTSSSNHEAVATPRRARVWERTKRRVSITVGDNELQRQTRGISTSGLLTKDGRGGIEVAAGNERSHGMEIAKEKYEALIGTEVRLWEEGAQRTKGMRKKERLSDYRYFPEPPDLPDVKLTEEFIDSDKTNLSDLPHEKRRGYESLGLSLQDIFVLTTYSSVAAIFYAVLDKRGEAEKAAHWTLGDIAAQLKNERLPITEMKMKPSTSTEPLHLIRDGTMSGKITKGVLPQLQIVENKGRMQTVNELCSSQAPWRPSLQTSPSKRSDSWSFPGVQRQLGHSFVPPTPNSRQCGRFGIFSAHSKFCSHAICASAEGFKFEVRELSKRAANNDLVLDRVSFDVKAGAVHGLVGPSGSGKTTVLRALNRLWEPSAGAVFYDGVDVTTMDVIKLRLQVGMVFQTPALFEGTVANNVKYGPKLRGIDLATERVEELLLQAGISEPSVTFMEKSSRELSGGEAQRVSVARALANEPTVLLMDEPTSSLDPTSTKMVENSIMSLVNNLGLTVVLVSHDLDQISRVADVATMLGKGGVVLETGTPMDLRSSDNLVLTEFFTA